MYGSILLVLSTLELSGASANPQLAKGAAPNVRQVEPEMADISGYYTCKGQEAGGKSYSGICVLTKKSDVYLVSWVVGGGSNFSGIAIRQGNSFAASWSLTTERGIVKGVNLYRIESGKSFFHQATCIFSFAVCCHHSLARSASHWSAASHAASANSRLSASAKRASGLLRRHIIITSSRSCGISS